MFAVWKIRQRSNWSYTVRKSIASSQMFFHQSFSRYGVNQAFIILVQYNIHFDCGWLVEWKTLGRRHPKNLFHTRTILVQNKCGNRYATEGESFKLFKLLVASYGLKYELNMVNKSNAICASQESRLWFINIHCLQTYYYLFD